MYLAIAKPMEWCRIWNIMYSSYIKVLKLVVDNSDKKIIDGMFGLSIIFTLTS